MGVSIQQYRAAIGLHQSRDNTPNSNSDNTSSFSSSSSTFSDLTHDIVAVLEVSLAVLLAATLQRYWQCHTGSDTGSILL